MFLNYFLSVLYSIKKYPIISAIKIFSLAIGLGCSILVIMHVQYATSFDKHIPNWERTYRMVASGTTGERIDFAQTADPYAAQMRLDYPHIEYLAKIRPDRGIFSRGDSLIEEPFFWGEPDIVEIFSLDFISGNPTTALDEPNSIILNETIARKYFPNEDAAGKTLTLETLARRSDMRITGIFRDLPENTHIDLQMLISVETGRRLLGEDFMAGDGWVSFSGTLTYLTVPSQAEAMAINGDLPNFIQRNFPEPQRRFAELVDLELALQPLSEIYLNPREGVANDDSSSRVQVLTALSLFGLLILLSSCINYTNLSLSQVQGRHKEIGIRKTLGADRRQIMIQFLFESFILTMLALVIAAPFIYFAVPVYTNLTRTGFTVETALQTDSVILLLSFVVVTGLLAGLLPAWAKSRLEPANVLKPLNGHKKSSQRVRSFITVVQFGFSAALIILAMGVVLQVNHLISMDPGLNMKNMVILDTTYNREGSEQFDYNAMFNELNEHPGVISITRANYSPPGNGSYNPWSRPTYGPDGFRVFSHLVVDENFLSTMQIKLLAGRGFQPGFTTDFIDMGQNPSDSKTEEIDIRSAVITRFAAEYFGFGSPEEALDEIIMRSGGDGRRQYRVIGVVEDFYMSGGLENTQRSTAILRATRDPLRIFLIRIDPNQSQSVLDHIDAVWNKHKPDTPINREFFEQIYQNMVYAQTDGIKKAAVFASFITLLISIFGLYALAYYSSQRRTKEVGVRKVLGAKSLSIYQLLTWDFVKPVLIACAIACIAGYLALNAYYEQFSSRPDIPTWLFLSVTVATVLAAVLTVAIQCFKTANSDPVKSLRYE